MPDPGTPTCSAYAGSCCPSDPPGPELNLLCPKSRPHPQGRLPKGLRLLGGSPLKAPPIGLAAATATTHAPFPAPSACASRQGAELERSAPSSVALCGLSIAAPSLLKCPALPQHRPAVQTGRWLLPPHALCPLPGGPPAFSGCRSPPHPSSLNLGTAAPDAPPRLPPAWARV